MSTAQPRALRVAMVHLSDWRLDSRIQRLARALAERGDEVHLVCIGEPAVEICGQGRIVVHPVMAAKPQGGYGAYLRGYSAFLVAATRKLAALGRRRRLDVVEAHNMPDLLTAAAIVPRLQGTPVVLNVHDTFPELFATKFGRAPRDPLVRLVELEERFSAALADRVVVVTEEAADRLASRGVGVGRTVVVMNAPDETAFGPARSPVPVPSDGDVRILYHGGLAPRFGPDVLVRSVEHLNGTRARVQVRVLGSGEDRDRLAALASDIAPERIDVAREPVPFAQIPDELAKAHVGVVPTIHDPFTELLLPVKLMEYVHAGLPVVASRLPAIERYFGDDAVRLFEPGSPKALAGALEDVVHDPAAASERAARATQRLAPLGWSEQRRRYLAMVDELVASRH
jgi:glycosyltransferase involved in cell wall biosynthesis